jgi:hypothetical protein
MIKQILRNDENWPTAGVKHHCPEILIYDPGAYS